MDTNRKYIQSLRDGGFGWEEKVEENCNTRL